ncbi:MAG: hypothetical protein Q4G49_05650, partial [Paracoccus sp. (in: a-proteobacteria)]|nr:hypothetical protein [Paracoccus sp. (in: a-proteobacteria)]
SASMWESTGRRIGRVLIAGILLAEVSKQVHAPAGPGVRVHVPSPLDVLGGIARPRPAGLRARESAVERT